MQGNEPGNKLFCKYQLCEEPVLSGGYCKVHQLQRAEIAEARNQKLLRTIAMLQANLEAALGLVREVNDGIPF